MTEKHKSICRVCHNFCAVEVEVDAGRVVGVSGDDENPIYHGYTCVKGRENWVLYNHPDRVLHCRKRTDAGYVTIPVDDAVGEIAERLQTIAERHGPRAVALFWGTYFALDNPINVSMGDAFMTALGSPMTFSPNTLDQPGKVLAKGLHGMWMAPGQGLHEPDVALLLGNNPLVSHLGPLGNPGDFVKGLARRGTTLIVVDPRRTEIAKRAAIHLQPRPGEDVAILAGIIRLIIEEHLYDADFVAENVAGFEDLRRTVAPFTPSFVAERADVNADDFVAAARIFGRAGRGYVAAGTGPNMSGQGTLVEYLVLCLDTICGHWLRAGEHIKSALTLIPDYCQPAKAQAFPPFPTYGFGEKMRVRGLTQTAAGMPAGALADEILLPGDGQIRALLSLGGNPASCVPDQLKMTEALTSLDLLVHTDVQMSLTAKLADYIIPVTLAYEMAGTSLFSDYTTLYGNGWGLPESYGQYTPAIVDPPPGSDVIEQWAFLYRLAQRMGLELRMFPGVGSAVPGGTDTPLDMTKDADPDELLAIIHAGSRIPLDEVKRHRAGALFPDPPVHVAAKDPGWEGRLDVGNATMMADLAAEASPQPELEEFPMRLITRRMMHIYNSPSLAIPANRPPYNPAFLNPADLARHGLTHGDLVEIRSARAGIVAVAGSDATVREGTVSITHCFGDTPGSDGDVRCTGSNPGRLLADDVVYDRYSGQPRMTNVPVRIAPAAGQ